MMVEEIRLMFQQIVDILLAKMEQDEDEDYYDGLSQDEVDFMRKTKEEDKDPARVQVERDSVKEIKEENEYDASFHNELESVSRMEEGIESPPHFQNEEDYLMIKMESLPLILTEDTVGYEESMGSPVKIGSRKETCIIASRAMGEEKKVPMKTMGVSLAPPPNLKARDVGVGNIVVSNLRTR
jgi:hypothetical protein